MSQCTILVVEDDADINNLLCTILSKNGYDVIAAFSGSEGLILINSRRFDIVLLDLMLPGLMGEELLGKIRCFYKMPVIVVSSKNNLVDKIELLKSGADDYITKPFNIEEVVARVEAQLRRYKDYDNANQNNKSILTHSDITLNIEIHEVRVSGNLISLTAKEYDILELLMTHPSKVFTKQNLFESIWKESYHCDDNTINVHISNLRNKLSKTQNFIQTLWGIGYKMST